MRRNSKLNCLIALLFTVVMVTGCGSAKYDAASSAGISPKKVNASVAEEAAVYDYGYDEAYEEAYDEGSASASNNSAEQVKDTGRKLIKTYSLQVETREFQSLITKVNSKVTALGGYIENCDMGILSYSKETHYANYVIRIPKEKADSFVETVELASNVTEKSESVEDVTLQYVDLESHKSALVTEQSRLLELLEKAESVEDIITVEERLSQVRYELESMESQLRTFDNKIDYSTIHLNIQEVEEITKPEEKTLGGRIKEELSENLVDIVVGLGDLVVWFIAGIPYWILLALFILLVVVIVRACVKFSKKQKVKAWEKQKAQQEKLQKQYREAQEAKAKAAQNEADKASAESEIENNKNEE